jgi:outer membrane lipoprotein SlyB
MRLRKLAVAMYGSGMLLLGGCASTSPPNSNVVASNVSGYGTVQSVEIVPRQESNNLAGTLGGAVVGGLLGHQIGGGTGNTVATLAGAAGGAAAGNQVQRNMSNGQAQQAYRITVRMDDGSTQTLLQDSVPGVQRGDHVRLVNGALVHRGR